MHGLWNTPKLFERLIARIEHKNFQVYTPHFPHNFGKISLQTLARDLNHQIMDLVPPDLDIDLVGFSMGGIVSRIWLQNYNGFKRTRRFISIGSPHNGTFTAQFVPSSLFPGIADMKRGSSLLSQLNGDMSSLMAIRCKSFYTKWDLMSFPGWQSKLSIGTSEQLPVLTHKGLITNPASLEILAKEIFRNVR